MLTPEKEAEEKNRGACAARRLLEQVPAPLFPS